VNLKFEICKCEDTQNPALYELTTHGAIPARLLIVHECDFWELYSTLAKHFENKARVAK
jgi:hypothetical protein